MACAGYEKVRLKMGKEEKARREAGSAKESDGSEEEIRKNEKEENERSKKRRKQTGKSSHAARTFLRIVQHIAL